MGTHACFRRRLPSVRRTHRATRLRLAGMLSACGLLLAGSLVPAADPPAEIVQDIR
jgi:hypothetical protein